MTEESLFLTALDRPPADRPAFLDRACAADPAFRQRLDVALAGFAADCAELGPPPADPISVYNRSQEGMSCRSTTGRKTMRTCSTISTSAGR